MKQIALLSDVRVLCVGQAPAVVACARVLEQLGAEIRWADGTGRQTWEHGSCVIARPGSDPPDRAPAGTQEGFDVILCDWLPTSQRASTNPKGRVAATPVLVS